MKTNRTPFTDECKLITQVKTPDGKGHYTTTETETELLCSVSAGVARMEFYEAYKAGVALSGTVEISEENYSKQRLLELDGVRYDILRVWPTGHGTLELTIAEVVR